MSLVVAPSDVRAHTVATKKAGDTIASGAGGLSNRVSRQATSLRVFKISGPARARVSPRVKEHPP